MNLYPNVICSKSPLEILDQISSEINSSPIANPTVGGNPTMTERVTNYVTRTK